MVRLIVMVRSSARSQDSRAIYKHQLNFYIQAMENPKMKLRDNFIQNGIKK